MGDVHGAQRAMAQVLERAKFDSATDRLIFLGDVCDGWPETRACVDALLRIPHLVHLIGNHDEWFLEWATGRHPGNVWVTQGGSATLGSYGFSPSSVPPSHVRFLKTAKAWHEEDGRLFVHGGWPWERKPHPTGCGTDELTWDRSLWSSACARHSHTETVQLTKFREVFVGHTTTTRINSVVPTRRCEVWNLDQGAGWEGVLSVMDVDTKEFWQSDPVAQLYPEVAGRRRRG